MLENPKVNIKIKLATLWAAALFCYVYGDYFELYAPEKINSLLTGENILSSPVKLLFASLVMSIPPIMIVISILATPKFNRIFNLLFGTLFTLMVLLVGISSITPWYSFYVFLAFLESIITFLIVWYAWNWPKNLQKQ